MPIQVVQTLMVAIQTIKQVYITVIKFVFLSVNIEHERQDSHKNIKYMAVISLNFHYLLQVKIKCQ
ncbi:hypothetical protein AYY25_02530 [Photobacterium phosphoreum]|nr:hypothetical protein AYY25_02530 [Photobacterium phosphoreum]